MVSVHKVQPHPQFISTSRHVMQGYTDLVVKPDWQADKKSLKATSKIVSKDPYTVFIACNGMTPVAAHASMGKATLGWKDKAKEIA